MSRRLDAPLCACALTKCGKEPTWPCPGHHALTCRAWAALSLRPNRAILEVRA
jgi:hypothetical protein